MRYWKRIDKDGKTIAVESYSITSVVAGAVEITDREYNDFIASFPVVAEPAPSISIEQDLQDIKRRVSELETRISQEGLSS